MGRGRRVREVIAKKQEKGGILSFTGWEYKT